MKKAGKSIDLKKTEKTIAILAQEIEDSKYRMGKTKANAYNTNMSTLERIKKCKFANIPIKKVTKEQILMCFKAYEDDNWKVIIE